jgi:hypothetical protein
MTATIGMENGVGSGKVSTREDRMHRGRKVVNAFLMQGWGQFANQVILILLMLIFHHGSGTPPISEVTAQWTYRVSFAIPAVGTLWLIYYRTYHMQSASRQLAVAKKKAAVTGYVRTPISIYLPLVRRFRKIHLCFQSLRLCRMVAASGPLPWLIAHARSPTIVENPLCSFHSFKRCLSLADLVE